ncbi:hypothetical protein Tco_1234907 [Tanacetum coccineum]
MSGFEGVESGLKRNSERASGRKSVPLWSGQTGRRSLGLSVTAYKNTPYGALPYKRVYGKAFFPYGTVELSQNSGPNFKVNGHRLKHYFGGDVPVMDIPDLQTFPKNN